MEIIRLDEISDTIGEFINKEFSSYAIQKDVTLNYDEFCFVAEEDSKILGVIKGRALYNEVHIVDLIVNHECRKSGIGSRLVAAVEDAYTHFNTRSRTMPFSDPEFAIGNGKHLL